MGEVIQALDCRAGNELLQTPLEREAVAARLKAEFERAAERKRREDESKGQMGTEEHKAQLSSILEQYRQLRSAKP